AAIVKPMTVSPANRSLALRLLLRCVALLLVVAAGTAYAQRFRFDRPLPQSNAVAVEEGEFTFARLIYGGAGRGWGRRGSWTTDWPEAEHFFMQGLSRLTRVNGTEVSIHNGAGAR